MRSKVFSGLSLPVAVLSGLCVMGPAPGADHGTPLSSTPKRVYPSGANISQKYEKPDPNADVPVETTAAPGRVSVTAATNNLLTQPRNRARVQKQLIPILRSQTRIQLDPGTGPAALTAVRAPALIRFTYGYQYKDVPLWKYSSQSQLIQVKNRTRKTILLRERNAPNLDQLGDTEPTVKTDDATKAGVDDCKDATSARLTVDNQNETPHREIHVDAQGKPTLAWAFVVRSTERARPFARRYWVAARGEPMILAKEDLIYHAAQNDTLQQGRVTGNFCGLRRLPFGPAREEPGPERLHGRGHAGGDHDHHRRQRLLQLRVGYSAQRPARGAVLQGHQRRGLAPDRDEQRSQPRLRRQDGGGTGAGQRLQVGQQRPRLRRRLHAGTTTTG